MKQIYLLFILSFFPSFVFGSKEYCSLIYQSGYHFLSITGVERADTATVVKMRSTIVPGKEFYLTSRELYLSDEKQRVYRFKYADGVNLQGANISSFTGYTDFSLVFEPMPKEVEIFDLRAANEQEARFAFWGIHTKRGALKRIKPANGNIRMREEGFLTPGYATVIGQINSNLPSKQDTLEMNISTMFFEDTWFSRTFKSPISPDGHFEFCVPLGCRTWARIEGKEIHIPVFMTPSDTLRVSVDNLRSVDMKVDYTSAKGNDVMANLMKADPRYSVSSYGIREFHPTEVREIYEKEREGVHKFVDYLSWKYHLTKSESHLLETDIKSDWIKSQILFFSRFFDDVYILGTHTQAYVDSVCVLPEVKESFEFLREIDLKDYAYFLLPEQKLLSTLAHSTPFSCGSSYNESYAKLECFLDRQLDEEWMKRLLFLTYTFYEGKYNPEQKIKEETMGDMK